MNNPKHFTLDEFLHSDTSLKHRIENIPSWEQINYLKVLGYMLDSIRKDYSKPIIVSSGYRSPELNKKVKGSATSEHMCLSGTAAADIYAADGDNKALWDVIMNKINTEEFYCGQLIWEYGTKDNPKWIHISTPSTRHTNEIKYIGIHV